MVTMPCPSPDTIASGRPRPNSDTVACDSATVPSMRAGSAPLPKGCVKVTSKGTTPIRPGPDTRSPRGSALSDRSGAATTLPATNLLLEKSVIRPCTEKLTSPACNFGTSGKRKVASSTARPSPICTSRPALVRNWNGGSSSKDRAAVRVESVFRITSACAGIRVISSTENTDPVMSITPPKGGVTDPRLTTIV